MIILGVDPGSLRTGYGAIATDGRYNSIFLNNYAIINLVDRIGSIPGVGEARLIARQDYGMRIWINPDRMAKLGLTATDVHNGTRACVGMAQCKSAAESSPVSLSLLRTRAGSVSEHRENRQPRDDRRTHRANRTPQGFQFSEVD